MTSGQQTYEYGGFYIAYLHDAPVIIQPGQSYSIVVTEQLDNGKYSLNYPIGFGPDNALILSEMADYYSIAVLNEGESHVYDGSQWVDWSDEDSRDELLSHEQGDIVLPEGTVIPSEIFYSLFNFQYDNFPLKGYAFDSPNEIYFRLAGDAKDVSVCLGESATASLELYGDVEGLSLSDFNITWSLAPGADENIEITPIENGAQVEIKGLSVGETSLVASISGVGTIIVPVTVHEHDWSSPTYTWSDDNTQVTAKRTCNICGAEESETVATTETITTEPTDTAAGKKTITATFTNAAFAPQTKTEPIPPISGGGSDSPSENPDTSRPSGTGKSTLPKTDDTFASMGRLITLMSILGTTLIGIGIQRRRSIR